MNVYQVNITYLEPVTAILDVAETSEEVLAQKLTDYFTKEGAVDFKINSIELLTLEANYIETDTRTIN